VSEAWWNHPHRNCRDLSIAYTGEDGLSSARLAGICASRGGCPVRLQCLDSALEEQDCNTVRGAATPRRLREIIEARRDEASGKPGQSRGRGKRAGMDAGQLYSKLLSDISLLVERQSGGEAECAARRRGTTPSQAESIARYRAVRAASMGLSPGALV